jgi:hypothetical protein
VKPLWKSLWKFLKKQKVQLPCDPAIQLLGIYPKECKLVNKIKHSCFIAALFTMLKLWNQSTCPSTDECAKKNVVQIHNGALFSYKIRMKLCCCRKMDETENHHVK